MAYNSEIRGRALDIWSNLTPLQKTRAIETYCEEHHLEYRDDLDGAEIQNVLEYLNLLRIPVKRNESTREEILTALEELWEFTKTQHPYLTKNSHPDSTFGRVKNILNEKINISSPAMA